MIHGFRIPDPTKGQSLVGLDFLGIYYDNMHVGLMGMVYSPKFVSKMFKGGNKNNKARYLGLILFENLDVGFVNMLHLLSP